MFHAVSPDRTLNHCVWRIWRKHSYSKEQKLLKERFCFWFLNFYWYFSYHVSIYIIELLSVPLIFLITPTEIMLELSHHKSSALSWATSFVPYNEIGMFTLSWGINHGGRSYDVMWKEREYEQPTISIMTDLDNSISFTSSLKGNKHSNNESFLSVTCIVFSYVSAIRKLNNLPVSFSVWNFSSY